MLSADCELLVFKKEGNSSEFPFTEATEAISNSKNPEKPLAVANAAKKS